MGQGGWEGEIDRYKKEEINRMGRKVLGGIGSRRENREYLTLFDFPSVPLAVSSLGDLLHA